MDEVTQLVRFAETAKGFDVVQKLKLILFAVKVKPNTYVVLKISPKNLEEKAHFEQHLKRNNIIFEVSRSKSYEEITQVKDNMIKWEIKGVWYGYDLFKTKKTKKEFKEYKRLLKAQEHAEADKIAGKIYGYPSCCNEEYTKEHDLNYVKQKYSYCQYYKRMLEQDKQRPFVFHYVCSPKCGATIKMNNKYSNAIKKFAPKLWQEYSAKEIIKTDVIIDTESDIFDDNAKSIWPNKDCHDYAAIALHQIKGSYYMLSCLTKSMIPRGTIASAKITMQYNYASVTLLSLKDFTEGVQHQRKFLLQ